MTNALLGIGRLNNFRLNALTPALAAIRRTKSRFLLNGEDVRGRVRVGSVSIRDAINDSPNSASFTIEGPPRSPYAEAVLADSPFAYWRLGDLGTTAYDQTGHGHTGTLIGAVTTNQPGAVSDGDRAMHFPGIAGARVEVPASASSDLTYPNAVTVEVWVNTTNATLISGILERAIGGVKNTAYALAQISGQWTWRIVLGGTLYDVTAPIEATDVGHWVHLVCGWASGAEYIYKNGGLVGARYDLPMAGTLAPGAGVFLIGHRGSNDYPFTGSLDEVAVYPYIDSNRIVAHYTAGRAVAAPTVAQEVRISIGVDNPTLLFNGALTQVDLSYEGRAHLPIYHCSATDDTLRANRRRPFGQWTAVSATTIAQTLVATFVQPGLPPVTVIFDGAEGMNRCLTQITNLIGGYWYFSDRQLHLFLSEITDPPDPIDVTHPFLEDPRIATSLDMSQVRTRVYGRGHGEALLADVTPTESLLPIADAIMFSPTGGKAIAGSQILNYAGSALGGQGSLVGIAAAPSVAPTCALVLGTGLGTGAYSYAYTDVTASGETRPGPLATIAVGPIAAPVNAPRGQGPYVGSGPDPGRHMWAVTFVTAPGETTLGPSWTGDTTLTLAPSAAPVPWVPEPGPGLDVGSHDYVSTFVTAVGETTPSPISAAAIATSTNAVVRVNIAIGAPEPGRSTSDVTSRRVYRRFNGSGPFRLVVTIPNNTQPNFTDTIPNASLGAVAPSTSTAYLQQFIIGNIPIGPALTSARTIYRTKANGSTFYVAGQVPNNTGTSWNDSIPDAQLGVAAPVTNTAIANRVQLSAIAVGPGGVTARKIYRSAVNTTSPLKLLTTLADNTTQTYLDSTPDASLGVTAPSGDTSGLTQQQGQVNAGATSMPTASTGPFLATGGWALIGTQAIRYTGISGNTLIGIPPSGPGAIAVTVRFGEHILSAPMLTGVTLPGGLVAPVGTVIYIWLQRDDADAQAAMARLDGGDGIYEYLVQDERRGEPSLTALCDAHLGMYSAPIQTVTYGTRDLKTKSGKPVSIDLSAPPILGTFVIQDVTIDQIDISPGLAPRFVVTASTMRFSFEDLLRQLAGTLENA